MADLETGFLKHEIMNIGQIKQFSNQLGTEVFPTALAKSIPFPRDIRRFRNQIVDMCCARV